MDQNWMFFGLIIWLAMFAFSVHSIIVGDRPLIFIIMVCVTFVTMFARLALEISIDNMLKYPNTVTAQKDLTLQAKIERCRKLHEIYPDLVFTIQP